MSVKSLLSLQTQHWLILTLPPKFTSKHWEIFR